MRDFVVLLYLFLIISSCDSSPSSLDQFTIDDIAYSFDREIRNEEERFRKALEEYYDLFTDPVKIKYRVLIPGLNKIISARSWNSHNYEVIRIALEGEQRISSRELLDYQSELMAIDSVIFNQIREVIYSNFDQIGFLEDQVERYLEEKRKEYGSVKNKCRVEVKNEKHLALLHKMIYLSNSERLKYLEEMLMELTGGKSSDCFGKMYFPVVVSQSSVFEVNGNKTIEVGVGQYSTLIYPPYARMIVENDTIVLSNRGVFKYELKPNSPGKHRLPIEITLMDPLTSEWRESMQGEYVFWIK